MLRLGLALSLVAASPSRAAPPPIVATEPSASLARLPPLQSPCSPPSGTRLPETPAAHGGSSANRAGLPGLPPIGGPGEADERADDAVGCEFAVLRRAMAREVAGLVRPSDHAVAELTSRALTLLGQAGRPIDTPQVVVVVDRNPAVQRLMLMLARPGGPAGWRLVGAAHVSTGQAGRKDYYLTPVGVFAHTDAILDFRAAGTRNEHHVRGLGLAGMRVWDFGWQWALKGWHTDGAGGDIRLQMHATDPDLLERKLGHPASEGCVRLSSSMNRFLDRRGVLDADYERAAATDIRYSTLLSPQRTPTRLAGRLLIVIDTSRPASDPPTSASRPPDWPSPDAVPAPAPDTM